MEELRLVWCHLEAEELLLKMVGSEDANCSWYMG